MKIKIETDQLTIVVETEGTELPPALIQLMPVVDQYEPHHVECLLEADMMITSVNVDHRELPF